MLYDDGRAPLGPSAGPEQLIHVKGGRIIGETPREMSLQDVRLAVRDFGHAAQVARDAGFDGVQIQGGYVYLFQQFLHEVTNRRADPYGGLVENRARILFEALEAVLEFGRASGWELSGTDDRVRSGPSTPPTRHFGRANTCTGKWQATSYRTCF